MVGVWDLKVFSGCRGGGFGNSVSGPHFIPLSEEPKLMKQGLRLSLLRQRAPNHQPMPPLGVLQLLRDALDLLLPRYSGKLLGLVAACGFPVCSIQGSRRMALGLRL